MPAAGLLIAVFSFAALFHGMTGIGFTLIPTAILSMQIGMRETVLLTAFPMLMVNFFSVTAGGPVMPVLRRYWLLALAGLAGSAAGVKLLLLVPSAWLQLALAALIGFYVFLSAGGRVPKLPEHPAAVAAVGFAAGIAGGAANAMSSVLLMYLLARSSDKNEIAQAGNLCFTLTKLVQIAMLWPMLRHTDFSLLVWPSAAALVCLLAGIRLRKHIPFRQFRYLSLGILSLLALMMAYRSITGLAA